MKVCREHSVIFLSGRIDNKYFRHSCYDDTMLYRDSLSLHYAHQHSG